MHTLETVLSLPDEALYPCLADHLATILDSFGVNGLGEIERTLWLAQEFEAAMRAGGLLAYTASPGWSRARPTADALA